MKEKIVIYDSNPVAAKGLREILMHCGYEVLDSIVGNAQLFSVIKKIKLDFIIVDPLFMPEKDISFFSQIMRFYPKVKVVVFASSESAYYILRNHQVRWSAYLSKNQPIEDFLQAMSVVDKKYNHLLFNNVKAPSLTDREHDALNYLTSREMQVLREIGAGKSNKMIATELKLSNKTISTYKRSIMDKFKTDDVRDIVDFARRHGF